jgi:hypothetical protein
MISELINSLVTELELCTVDNVIKVDGLKVYPYRLPFKKQPPKQVNGLAPDSQPVPDLPAIVVQFDDTSTDELFSEKGKIARITFVIGMLNDNPIIGISNVLNVAEKLEEYFTKKPVVAGKFRLEYPIKIRLYNDQPHPQYFAGVETDWNLPQPVPDFVIN